MVEDSDARPCGWLYVTTHGAPRERLEAALDQAAHMWMCELLTKGCEHPHTVAASAEHMRLSRIYCKRYL